MGMGRELPWSHPAQPEEVGRGLGAMSLRAQPLPAASSHPDKFPCNTSHVEMRIASQKALQKLLGSWG